MLRPTTRATLLEALREARAGSELPVMYHCTFASRAQACAFAAQERKAYPADLFDTALSIAPRTDRPATGAFPVPADYLDVPGAAHQWTVDGSRRSSPRTR